MKFEIRRVRSLVIAMSMLIWIAGPAMATSVAYESFESLVARADGVVIGTVRDIRSVADEDGSIWTFVTLDRLEVVLGSYEGDSLTLRLMGGQVEGEVLEVEGAPHFALEEEVILFVEGNGTQIVPFVGWEQGVFRTQEDRSIGRRVVTDSAGNRVFEIRGDKVVKEHRFASEAGILGEPSRSDLQRHQSEEQPEASGPGASDDGSETPRAGAEERAEQGAPKTGPPMTVEGFAAAVRKRAQERQAGASRGNGPTFRSFEVGDFSGAHAKGFDAAPRRGEPAASPESSDSEPGRPVLPRPAQERSNAR